MGKKVFGEASLRTLLADLKTQFDTKADLADGKLATAQMPQISWNDLQDRPFGETYTVQPIDLVWPTDTTDLVTVSGESITFYRVSDALSAEELLGATIEILIHRDGADETQSLDCTASNIEVTTAYVMAPLLLSILSPNATVDGVTFNVPGTYVVQQIMGEDQYLRFSRATKAGGTFVTKLSYNDLSDTPCSTSTIAGYHYTLPQDVEHADYIYSEWDMELDHDMPGHIAAKYYLVGDALTCAQLYGSEAEVEYTMVMDGQSDTQTGAQPIDAGDIDEHDLYLDIFDGVLRSVLSDGVNINGTTFNRGTYLSICDMAASDGSMNMVSKVLSLTKASTVEVRTLDKDLVPNISELNGTISPTQLPELSELNGSLTADQLPQLSELNGSVTASQVPQISELTGYLSASQVPELSELRGKATANQIPDLNQLNGSVTASQVPPLSELSGSLPVSKLSGYETTPKAQEYSYTLDPRAPLYTLSDTSEPVLLRKLCDNLSSLYGLSKAGLQNGTLTFLPNDESFGAAEQQVVLTDENMSVTSEVIVVSDPDVLNGAVLLIASLYGGTYRGTYLPRGVYVADALRSPTLSKDADTSERTKQLWDNPKWSQLQGKPFGNQNRTIPYATHGNNPFDSGVVVTGDPTVTYYRVGDYLALTDLIGASCTLRLSAYHQSANYIIRYGHCAEVSTTDGQTAVTYVTVAHPDWANIGIPLFISTPATIQVNDATLTAGLWMADSDFVDASVYSLALCEPTVKTIDSKYLPPARILPSVSATDNGKVLKVANGVWSIGEDASGGGLPVNFPTESAANANKLIGFDENGNYTAKEGGESTPTPETILSLTVPQQEAHDGAYTCSIQYADLTQEQQEAVESLAAENYSLFLNTTDRPLTRQAEELAYVSYAYNFDDQEGPTAEDFLGFSIVYDHGQIDVVSVMSNSDLTGETLNLIGYVDASPSDGGQFVVMFSDVDFEEMTIGLPDKTGAEIYAAIQANQPIVASLGGVVFVPLVQVAYDSATVFDFTFTVAAGDGLLTVTYSYDDSEKTGINLMIPASYTELQALEPLIVNLTLDGTGETPMLVGNKTYGDIKNAQFAGKHVILKGSLEDKGDFAASIIDVVYGAEENTVAITYANAGQLVFTGGLASDFFSIAAE